jgi:uncharacterized alkaline shock family protein YloU
MVRIRDLQGDTLLTNDFFTQLIGESIKQCYGVVGMANATTTGLVLDKVFDRDRPEKGVKVSEEDGALVIDLHVVVIYGVNINTIVETIKERVSYVVKSSTKLRVKKVNVYIDDIIAR